MWTGANAPMALSSSCGNWAGGGTAASNVTSDTEVFDPIYATTCGTPLRLRCFQSDE